MPEPRVRDLVGDDRVSVGRRGPTRYTVEIAGQVFVLSSPVEIRIDAPEDALPGDVVIRVAERALVAFAPD